MEEEKFARYARKPYLISYPIFIAAGLIFVAVGALWVVAEPEFPFFGGILIFLGAFLTVSSIIWLIHFIRLPEYAITYKDGKLKFNNKIECTPAELDYFSPKGGGLDGAMMGYGRLIISINGKKYKMRFIYDVNVVVQKLGAIKTEYIVKQDFIKQKTGESNG